MNLGRLANWSQFSQLKPRSRAILKKFFAATTALIRGIWPGNTRRSFDQTPDGLQARFDAHAPPSPRGRAKRIEKCGCQPKKWTR